MTSNSQPITLRELAQKPVRDLDAVGPKLEERLAQMELVSVLDIANVKWARDAETPSIPTLTSAATSRIAVSAATQD